MLRIDVVKSSEKDVVLRVEGDLSEKTVAVLSAEGNKWRRSRERLVLDLDGALRIDEAGIALLRRYAGENVRLQCASLFLNELLEKHGIAVCQSDL